MAYVRVINGHDDEYEYHEWITRGDRIRADINGRPQPRMYDVNWTLWYCNNTECIAQALVHDDAIRHLIEMKEQA